MLRIAIPALLVLPFFVATPSDACEGHDQVTLASAGDHAKTTETSAPKADVKTTEKVEKAGVKSELPTVTVDELATLIEKNKKDPTTVAVFDVNGADTRKSKGVIPGAVLLPSASQFDLAVLPAKKDANLVFYCANTQCGASHSAAKRAVEAGYKQVKVLPAGIDGWVAAGKPIAKQPVG